MPDETWAQIHAQRPRLDPPSGCLVVPLIPHPVCPEHCRYHTVDSVIQCRRCGGERAHVLAHEWPQSGGHYWHSVDDRGTGPLVCCGEPMRRVWR